MDKSSGIGALGGVLVLVLVAVSSLTCGKDSPTGTGNTGGGADKTISIVANNLSNSYSPNPDTVTVGQTVSWRNTQSASHSSTANGGSWDTGLLAPNTTSAPIAMTTAGSFSYHCSAHPPMVGTLVVKP